MVLFMQGFTQFIIWSKIMDTINNMSFDSIFNTAEGVAKATTAQVVDNLTKLINKFFEDYPPKYTATVNNVQWAIGNISEIPDSFWPGLAKYATTGEDKDAPNEDQLNTFFTYFNDMSTSMENSLLETFGIDLVEEVTDDNKNITETGLETKVNEKMWARFDLVVSTFSQPSVSPVLTILCSSNTPISPQESLSS